MAKFKSAGDRTKVFMRDIGTAQFVNGQYETDDEREIQALRATDDVEEVQAKAPVQSKDTASSTTTKRKRSSKKPVQSKDSK